MTRYRTLLGADYDQWDGLCEACYTVPARILYCPACLGEFSNDRLKEYEEFLLTDLPDSKYVRVELDFVHEMLQINYHFNEIAGRLTGGGDTAQFLKGKLIKFREFATRKQDKE